MIRLRDVNIVSENPIVSPSALMQEFPVVPAAYETIVKGRSQMIEILKGEDSRPAIMVGPCSIHSPEEALEYADRLAALSKEVSDRLFILMRVYFEKPRTTIGWTGLLAEPHLDGTFDLEKGLRIGRELMLKICEKGLPIVTEFLGPIVPQFLGDLVVTGTIGARTTESQTHREMASGLSMPVGFKNGTNGKVKNALDAFVSAQSPHSFLGLGSDGCSRVLNTRGNPNGYLILRGGDGLTNFDEGSVAVALDEIRKRKLECKIVVDCSHGNSMKKHSNQRAAFDAAMRQVATRQSGIAGLMLESNLVQGRQDLVLGTPPAYGVSITDECIGWEETRELIMSAYAML